MAALGLPALLLPLLLALSAPKPAVCTGLGREGASRSVTPGTLPCIPGCTCSGEQLDCSKQAWTHIPHQLPSWVVYLNLSYNKLATIDPSVFTELHSLREIRLDHNELTAIPEIGPPSASLVFLYLHHNKIRSIEPNHLSYYQSLETLDLTYNEITEIQNNCFPWQLKIKDLYLSNNRISILEPGTFDNLSSTLQVLRLSKNRISHLPVKIFKLPHLLHLELNRNRIRLIDGLTFQGLDSLEVLKLQRNNISKLMDGAFWGLARMQVLHLDNNVLNEVKSGWLYGLSSLQQLFLNYNTISRIHPDAWGFCQKLVELNLSHNNLIRLDEGSLTGLSGLQILRLSHNSISHIADGTFKGLRTLRVLELDNNEISGIIEDTNGAFVGLDGLSKLTLFGNEIKSIAKKAFIGLEALEHLNLGNNMIRSIQEEAFTKMKNLKELSMNSDSFLCDCQLKWLPQWLIGKGFQSSIVATCAHPESLKGQSIFIVAAESFVCDDFPKPQIIVQPETTMAMLGKDIRFTCSAASSSNFPMIFAWKKDHEILHNAEIENFAHVQAKNGEVVEYTTSLLLRKVKFSDEGRYQCIITNNFGSTYSNKAKLTVNVLPSFVKTPRDITIRTGANARLECAATGHPTPQIAWQKDGGTDFPAARERRMHVMPEDDVFFIVDVKIEDMGIYTCTAQNIAGAILANASLMVLETPSLVYALEDQTAVIGETIALQCMASGSPSPRITWLKGDEPLVVTKRHHFTSGNQLLIIRNVVLDDEGKYTCEMSNTLGTERAHSHLSVLPSSRCVVGQSKKDGTMTVGIVVIAVVCSIVITSLVWVCIIYQTRKKSEEYSVTNTDETIVPPDVPSYLSSQGTLSEHQETCVKIDDSSNLQLAATLSNGRMESNGMCQSNAVSCVEVASHNHCSQTNCFGCNVNDGCKHVAGGRLGSEKTDQFGTTNISSKEHEWSNPNKCVDHVDENHGTEWNGTDEGILNCYLCNGTSSGIRERQGLVYPSNHDRMVSQVQNVTPAKIADTKGLSSKPVQFCQEHHKPVQLPLLETSSHQSVPLCEKPQSVLCCDAEGDIKQSLLLNGQLSQSYNLV
ncbi:leucine-rich repeats and immunoglobulin-like domains protein 1 isoform X2 [Chiloscyllium plagiosum]|uniref:leucine-rich repeats and immunoglobulin-like domains protein 1 isoform X2 n=1 Tax=Chiloscyllium plagiosum TaxID=36176 RepID=UPI001CB87775|nr:leucine-rich repeats and immunoglobulin-like domains protein 1 isoform X2 [Chiloscyllium plagiosum]